MREAVKLYTKKHHRPNKETKRGNLFLPPPSPPSPHPLENNCNNCILVLFHRCKCCKKGMFINCLKDTFCNLQWVTNETANNTSTPPSGQSYF